VSSGRLISTVMAAGIVAVLLSLGTWQLVRLAWKTDLIETMEARLASEPIPLEEALDLPRAEQEWQPVTARGRLLDESFVLYRIRADGHPGYHILTPLELDDGRYILVNRGSLMADSFRLALAEMPPVPEAAVEVTGVLRPGEEPGWFTNDNDPANQAWFWIELDLAAETAGVDLLPVVIHADADPAGTDLTGGQARFDPPNRHLEYAITWYCLAIAAAVIFTLRLRRRRSDGGAA